MAESSLWALGGLSWWQLAKRVYNEILEDDVLGSSAQLAYYFLFALFPLLIFLTSLLGFAVGADSELRNELFTYLGSVLPGSALDLVRTTITEVSQASSGGKISLGIFLALWAASSGLDAVTTSLNRAYDVKESRPWWKTKLISVGLTIALALSIISALVIILFGAHIVDYAENAFGLGTVVTTLWTIGQYLIALCFVMLAFALIYYFSPDVKQQSWLFVTPGSVIGVGLWILVSLGFRLYLSYFDSYSATYGSLGAIIILLLWLYFTGAAILIGGEFNSEIEHAAAEAGAPEAKQEGEKTPQQNSGSTASTATADKKPIEPEIVKPEKKPFRAKGASPVQPMEQPHGQPSFLAKVATIGSMIAGVFMSFGKSKNDKQ